MLVSRPSASIRAVITHGPSGSCLFPWGFESRSSRLYEACISANIFISESCFCFYFWLLFEGPDFRDFMGPHRCSSGVVLSIAMLRWCPMQVFKVDEKIILAALVECWPSQATWLDSGACTKKINRIDSRGPKLDPKMGPKTGPKIEHKTGPKKPAHVKPFNCRA